MVYPEHSLFLSEIGTGPNGRTINYNYGDTGGVLMNNNNAMLDQAIGRLDGIVDGANSGDAGQVLESRCVGISASDRILGCSLNRCGRVGSGGSIGSGGDEYVGLDRFGRVVNQNWVNSAGTTVDGYTYTYDANSNVTAKNNVLDSAYSETYTYDSLNRLTASTRGGASYQSWGLDAQGNWSSFTSNGSTQTRTANAQNQITSVSGLLSPEYDANGNMTTDQNGNTLVYDAWNQLVAVSNSSGQVIAQYTYDARGYRVTESYPQGGSGVPAGTVNYFYYDSNWQAVETRTNGTAASNVTSQTVWSASYINAAVLHDTYSGGVIQPNSRLYVVQDANWDTAAVVGYDAATGTWNVVQRYVYSPYGTITVLNADWSATPVGTTPLVQNLYQGMLQDPVTGLYYERARWYSPSLGTWISQDPLQYINGANTYQMEMGSPTAATDPSGQDQVSVSYNLTPQWLKSATEDIWNAGKTVSHEFSSVEKYVPGATAFFTPIGNANVEASIKGEADVEQGKLCSASLSLEAEIGKIGFNAGLQASADILVGQLGIFATGSATLDIEAKYSQAKGWEFSGGGGVDVKAGIFGNLTGADIVRAQASGGINVSYTFDINQSGELSGKGNWDLYGSLSFLHRGYLFWGSWESTYTYTFSGSNHPFGQIGPSDVTPEFEAALSAAGA